MKKILAIAIASAFAAPAFAATANVDVYGTAAMSVDYVDGGSGGANTISSKPSESRMRVESNTSLIGFKGAEDLGGGLSAVWQIEQSLNLDTGGGSFATGRNNFAGLSSKSLGSLTFGLQDTPFKTSTGKLDVFGGGHYLADYRSLFGGVTNGSVRASNSVLYTSPSFSGLTVRAMSGAQQENGSSKSPHLYGLSGVYENGPLYATLAYESTNYQTAASSIVAGAGGNSIRTAAASTADTDQKNWRLGVGYSFGNTKLGVGYERVKYDYDALSGTLTAVDADGNIVAAGTTGSAKRNAWYLSAAHKIGNVTLKGAYTDAGDIRGISNTGAKQYSLGANYSLSKRTDLFGLYTQVKNDSGAAYTLGGSPTGGGGGTGISAVSPALTGQDPKGISVGMIHKF
ncbi:MAG TPA: porin [Thiobacillus sp.]